MGAALWAMGIAHSLASHFCAFSCLHTSAALRELALLTGSWGPSSLCPGHMLSVGCTPLHGPVRSLNYACQPAASFPLIPKSSLSSSPPWLPRPVPGNTTHSNKGHAGFSTVTLFLGWDFRFSTHGAHFHFRDSAVPRQMGARISSGGRPAALGSSPRARPAETIQSP